MSVKSFIKNGITNHIDANYQLAVKKDSISFAEWIVEKESAFEHIEMSPDAPSFVAKLKGVSIRVIPYNLVDASFKVSNYIEDVLLFTNGELSEIALPLIADMFSGNMDISVVYGDEDIADMDYSLLKKQGHNAYLNRRDPYFKPDWSPNTFMDHFYFCNIVAIRRVEFREFSWSTGFEGAASIYHTLLRYLFSFERNLIKVAHIDEILIHATDYDNNGLKDSDIAHLTERLVVDFDARKNPSFGEENEVISVIIPSKDNPHLLDPCIASITSVSHDGIDLDIIVVDNGSSKENLTKIEELKEKYGFRHIYEPMDFNFAKMCNIGASLAKSEYLLFLNDDVTFIEPGTLNTMLREVKFRFSGAVGPRLLYPDGEKIQHAGVFNNRIGPVHKLQFMSKETRHYQGFAQTVNNVIAVTGACLLVRKEVYNQVGGMNENLKVAFNDIDLCFKIFEKGYVNVVCNNVSLIHAESISRGKDTSEDALKRLLTEKDKLYAYHPVLKAYDPFYNKYLINDCLDTRIVPASEYECSKVLESIVAFTTWEKRGARLEPCLQHGIEYSGLLSGYTYEENASKDYFIQGYAFVTGSDNACYKRSILLYNEEKDEVLVAPFNGCLRTDVAANLPDQKNVERSGFALYIKEGLLPSGKYRVGILFENIIAREKLYSLSNNFVSVE